MRPKRDKLLINMTLMGVCIAMLLSVGVSMSFGQSDTQNRQKELAEHQFLFEYIYFKVDKTAMLPSSVGALDRKVEWLKKNPQVSVIIEGYCDERGSDEFNLLLGEARAGKIKTYLIQKGIQASRLLTISYGEEDLVDQQQNEEAWSKNRRVRFMIQ
jgi:peptidoglycan-associated lipoprotein